MLKFLLNANLSPLTKEFLERKFGYDVKTTKDLNLQKASDEEIVKSAIKEKRVIITLDMDFGEIYYFSSGKVLSIIVLKLKVQTVEMVNKVLNNLFRSKVAEKYLDALIIVDEKKYRIRTKG